MSTGNREAVAYFRIESATNVGADLHSVKFQKAVVDAHAKSAGYDIVGTYHDPVVSDADPIDERSGFAEMLGQLRLTGPRTIIVESPDRFARDSMVQLVGNEVLKAKGISLVAASAPRFFVTDTPTVVLVRQLVEAVAQWTGVVEKATRVSDLAAAPKHAMLVDTQSVIEVLQEKGFHISPRFASDGAPRFYVWGGPEQAKHIHVKHDLTAEQMTERYRFWLDDPRKAGSIA